MNTHKPIKILNYSVLNVENRIMELFFLDVKKTIQFTFLNKKKDYWNQWHSDGIRFDKDIQIDDRDIWWGNEKQIAFHSEIFYYDEYVKLGIYKVLSITPISSTITPFEYSKLCGITKMAIMQRIWRNKLPHNIKAIKNQDGEYILHIN